MAANKTVANAASTSEFVKGIADTTKRADCKAIMKMMRAATGNRAKMWGSSIIGFGQYNYRYETGREGSAVLTGLSPRAQNIAIYIMPGFSAYGALLKKLGKHKIGKSCLYIKRLSDVEPDVLAAIIERSVADMKKKYKIS